MSKPVKNLITESYKQRFAELEGAVLIDIRGIKSNDNNTLRAGLADKKVKVTVVKNSLAKRALDGTALASLGPMLEGPSAMVFGADSVVTVARELLAAIKGMENVQIKGALMDGVIFAAGDVEATLSKYPTRREAQGQVIQIFLGPVTQVIGAALSAGGALAGVLSTIQEKLEKGEAIARAS